MLGDVGPLLCLQPRKSWRPLGLSPGPAVAHQSCQPLSKAGVSEHRATEMEKNRLSGQGARGRQKRQALPKWRWRQEKNKGFSGTWPQGHPLSHLVWILWANLTISSLAQPGDH